MPENVNKELFDFINQNPGKTVFEWAAKRILDTTWNIVYSLYQKKISPEKQRPEKQRAEKQKAEKQKSKEEIIDLIRSSILPDTTFEGIIKSISAESRRIEEWADRSTLKNYVAKKVSYIYIELDLDFEIKRERVIESKSGKKSKFLTIFSEENGHLIILGDPGAGKTTSMKALCRKLKTDSNYCIQYSRNVVRLLLRDLNNNFENVQLYDALLQYLGVYINFERLLEPHLIEDLKLKLLSEILNELKLVIILDGFDELSTYSYKEKVMRQFKKLCDEVVDSKIILTSRLGDYTYHIENAKTFQICQLTEPQIKEFISKRIESEFEQKDLYEQISNSPFRDTIGRPLTLAHLCSIFEVYKRIPEKPKTVYKKIVSLLLEDWNIEQDVFRKSTFGDFDADRKFEFLTILAYKLTELTSSTVFIDEQLKVVYFKICDQFNLPKNELKKVVNEIETDNGLFIRSGFEQFEFCHKSIQEYLCAEYFMRSSENSDRGYFLNNPDVFALCTALNLNPSIYQFNVLIGSLREELLSENFLSSYLKRVVVEKPDFEISPVNAILIGYILHLYNFGSISIEKIKVHGTPTANIIELLKKFAKLQNIRESFDLFDNIYKPVKENNRAYRQISEKNNFTTNLSNFLIYERVAPVSKVNNTLLPKNLVLSKGWKDKFI